eukprot:TRINITY_DN5313_c0_g2_i4.p1 TRINITY_DN5313_c0_g2~~TRINITY_DN5313_c0_g2_i4.p1  ORF type:complete len:892 (-),score=275.71 TRINITY_DN5313_c0_g2_i4:9-2684(-)
MSLHIFVTEQNGNKHEIKLSGRNEKLSKVRDSIQKILGIEPNQQRELPIEGLLFKDFKVSTGATLLLIKRRVPVQSNDRESEGKEEKDEFQLKMEEEDREMRRDASHSELNENESDEIAEFVCKMKEGETLQETNDYSKNILSRFNSVFSVDRALLDRIRERNQKENEEILWKLSFDFEEGDVPKDWSSLCVLKMNGEDRKYQLSPRFFGIPNCNPKLNENRITFEFDSTELNPQYDFVFGDLSYYSLGEEAEDSGCLICRKRDNTDKMILCDSCDQGYHIYCLNPPVKIEELGEVWYCPKCFKQKKVKKPAKKLAPSELTTKEWGKGMACAGRIEECSTVAINHFGKIPGVPVGSYFPYRIFASEAGVHRPTMGGIHGQEKLGAFSVCLSGGYEDDEDHGDWFIYTGSGGRDLKSKNRRTAPQTSDQQLKSFNLALTVSCYGKKKSCKSCSEDKMCEDCRENWRNGKEIRVLRGYKFAKVSKFAPKEGFRYDGIYKIEDWWFETGISGFKVIKYRFRRDDDEPAPWTQEGKQIAMELKILGEQRYSPRLELQEKNKRKREQEEEDTKDQKSDSYAFYALSDEDTLPETSPKHEENNNEFTDHQNIQSNVINQKVQRVQTPVKQTKQTSLPFLKPSTPSWLDDSMLELMKEDRRNQSTWNVIMIELLKGCNVSTENIFSNFKCLICDSVPDSPVTSQCGHNYCRTCIYLMARQTNGFCACGKALDLSNDEWKRENSILCNIFKRLRTIPESFSALDPLPDYEEKREEVQKKVVVPIQPKPWLDDKLKKIIKKDFLNESKWDEILEDIDNNKLKSVVDGFKRIEAEFSCIICHSLVSNTVTTPCSHNYCSDCFKRLNQSCAVCRATLQRVIARNSHLNDVIRKLFPHTSQRT